LPIQTLRTEVCTGVALFNFKTKSDIDWANECQRIIY
jgi:hypothetical protein